MAFGKLKVDQIETSTQTLNVDNLATTASPALTGNPTAPTPSAGDADTSIATTAFVDTSFAKKASPTFTGDVTINAQGDIRFADSDSSNYIALQAPATIGSNVTLTLPAADGSANQYLKTDGNGVLAWVSPTAAPVDSVGGQTGAVTYATSWAVGTGATAAANTDFDLTGTYAQTPVAVAALDITTDAGNYFTKTINGNSTFTFGTGSKVPASRSYGFVLELTHTSGTITWPASVKWPADTAPTLATGKTHLFVFHTDDGGTRWRGSSLADYTT